MGSIQDFSTVRSFELANTLPKDFAVGTWIGRAWLPKAMSASGVAGPHLITIRSGTAMDITHHFNTLSSLIRCNNPTDEVSRIDGRLICDIGELLNNSLFHKLGKVPEEADIPFLLAPNDIQAVKACGVTFALSLIERVIEEKAQGDKNRALEIRDLINSVVGANLAGLAPGSAQALALKEELINEGIWSQYLEVGIGPDAEVFTKAQPLSSITTGAQLGVLATSDWNNPEPEIALLVTPNAQIVGATLGNDVNLRDYEGRSALLLGKAKDQNGSCCLGPLIRLFDGSFGIDDVLKAEVSLSIAGEDGFVLQGVNKMNQISRHPEDIVEQVCNRSHQYPDGLMLFLGTMFAPAEDREEAGSGFTHKVGDRVEISSPKLGKLVNWVNYCHEIPEWRYGLTDLMQFIADSRIEKFSAAAD